MKFMKVCMAAAALLFFGITTFAQEVDLTKGDLSILKDEKTINIEYNLPMKKCRLGILAKKQII